MLYDESRETIEWLWEWWLYCYGGMGCSVGGIEFRNLLTVTEEKSTEGGRSLIRTARAAA